MLIQSRCIFRTFIFATAQVPATRKRNSMQYDRTFLVVTRHTKKTMCCVVAVANCLCINLSININLFQRITEWFGLEGTLKIIWFQPPCHKQGHLPLDEVAQSSIPPGLEHCQGGGSHSCSGQPIPVFHHPQTKEFLPNI